MEYTYGKGYFVGIYRQNLVCHKFSKSQYPSEKRQTAGQERYGGLFTRNLCEKQIGFNGFTKKYLR